MFFLIFNEKLRVLFGPFLLLVLKDRVFDIKKVLGDKK